MGVVRIHPGELIFAGSTCNSAAGKIHAGVLAEYGHLFGDLYHCAGVDRAGQLIGSFLDQIIPEVAQAVFVSVQSLATVGEVTTHFGVNHGNANIAAGAKLPKYTPPVCDQCLPPADNLPSSAKTDTSGPEYAYEFTFYAGSWFYPNTDLTKLSAIDSTIQQFHAHITDVCSAAMGLHNRLAEHRGPDIERLRSEVLSLYGIYTDIDSYIGQVLDIVYHCHYQVGYTQGAMDELYRNYTHDALYHSDDQERVKTQYGAQFGAHATGLFDALVKVIIKVLPKVLTGLKNLIAKLRAWLAKISKDTKDTDKPSDTPTEPAPEPTPKPTEPPTPVGPKNYQDVLARFRQLRKSISQSSKIKIREVNNKEELDELWNELTKNGKPVSWDRYNGTVFELPDGTLIGRRISGKYGDTIDVIPNQNIIPKPKPLKIHIKGY